MNTVLGEEEKCVDQTSVLHSRWTSLTDNWFSAATDPAARDVAARYSATVDVHRIRTLTRTPADMSR